MNFKRINALKRIEKQLLEKRTEEMQSAQLVYSWT